LIFYSILFGFLISFSTSIYAASWTQTTDSDFNSGILTDVVVEGTGDAAYLRLPRYAVFSNSGGGAWTKRKPIAISNTASALADYQIFISTTQIDTSNLISTGKMQADLDDVRFSDEDGETELSYWIEPDTVNPRGFWVKVPSIPANSSKTIYLYYGNSSAVSRSNGTATFELFDDFDDGEINPTVWISDGEVTISNGIAVIGKLGVGGGSIKSENAFGINCAMRSSFYLKKDTDSAIVVKGGFDNATWAFWSAGIIAYDDHIFADSWGGSQGVAERTSLSLGVYYVYEIIRDNGTSNIYKANGETLATHTGGTVTSSNIYIVFGADGTVTQVKVDWILVRKYTSLEPTVSVGAEENIGISSGTFISSAYKYHAAPLWGNISWTENLPSGTDITFQTRTSDDGSSWSSWSTELSDPTGSTILSPSARYIQCKANFVTTISTQTPTLSDFTITYNCQPLTSTNFSPSSRESLPRETKNPTFQWSTFSDTDGDSQIALQVQVRKEGGVYGDENSKDSGKLDSSLDLFTPSDFDLATGTYYWRVRVKDDSGFENAWSQWSNETVFYIENNTPFLSWTGETNYTSDGLNPETGDTSTNFVFGISYSDADNDEPKSDYPKLHIKKGFPGQTVSEISGSPFIMNYVSGNYNTGAIFSYSIKLEPGQYTYYFEAYDMYNAKATGEPTNEGSGPAVIGEPPETKEMKVYHGVFKSAENEKCYVSFNLEQAGETTIKVYNSLGREVKQLYSGTATPGLNTIPWDGTDGNGNKVSSGVYIIRIEGPGIKQQKRVVVVR
jgi:hypothetical protein